LQYLSEQHLQQQHLREQQRLEEEQFLQQQSLQQQFQQQQQHQRFLQQQQVQPPPPVLGVCSATGHGKGRGKRDADTLASSTSIEGYGRAVAFHAGRNVYKRVSSLTVALCPSPSAAGSNAAARATGSTQRAAENAKSARLILCTGKTSGSRYSNVSCTVHYIMGCIMLLRVHSGSSHLVRFF
jgi:hypothetical protein